jgi:hypothetical protein
MKGGSKVKAILVMVILLLVGVLAVVGVGAVRTYMSGAAGGSTPTGVVANSNPDCRGFTVMFKTDSEVQPVIMYGMSPSSLVLQKPGDVKATDHSFLIEPLRPGVAVYYKIKIGEEVYDNGGIPYDVRICNDATDDIPITEEVPNMMEEPVLVPTTSESNPSLVPTTAAVTPASTTNNSECNKTTDYDGDGMVTTVDYYRCMQGLPTPTTKVLDDCFNVDFNKDGIINTMDRIQCLNSKVQ